MKYIDRNGNLVSKKDSVNNLLTKIYSNKILSKLINLITTRAFSVIGGIALSSKISKCLIRNFIKNNNIDMSIYEEKEYSSYNDFFTRKIKAGNRNFSNNDNDLSSPSDGKISIYDINKDSIFEIKNSFYNLSSLLKNNKLAEQFEGGSIAIIRLSVDNYHRYSYIDDGKKSKNYKINGRYFSVDPVVLENIKVFKENTREYCLIKSKNFGTFIQMEVGATLVGKITNIHQECEIKRGEEKGYFEFGGSTIILIFQKDRVEFFDKFKNSNYEVEVFMGDVIGRSKKL